MMFAMWNDFLDRVYFPATEWVVKHTIGMERYDRWLDIDNYPNPRRPRSQR